MLAFLQAMPPSVLEAARKIKLLALDVDGVMTDGSVYFTAQGDEIKAFNILDGQGIKQLQKAGFDIAIITGRTSPLTEKRARDLGITLLRQGREDKLIALRELLSDLAMTLEQVAYVGDDLPDLSAIKAVGLGITVQNAHPLITPQADWVTPLAGGRGAVRQVCDLLLHAQGKLESTYAGFL